MSSWIKMSVGLRRHPKVVRMASALKSDKLRVVGALHAVWSVFDEHSTDGQLPGYSLAIMDDEIGWRGFSRAMTDIGWLVADEEGLRVPDYEEHNGPTAKRRATETRRKNETRSGQKSDRMEDWQQTKSGQVSASDAGTLRARIDKRREEEKENHPLPFPDVKGVLAVHGFPPGFEAFWTAYPRKVGKDAAAKAFAKRRPSAELLSAMLQAVAQQGQSEAWRKDRGQFIPHPATWLNEGRWQDEATAAGVVVDSGGVAANVAAATTAAYLAEHARHAEASKSPEADAARRAAMARIHPPKPQEQTA